METGKLESRSHMAYYGVASLNVQKVGLEAPDVVPQPGFDCPLSYIESLSRQQFAEKNQVHAGVVREELDDVFINIWRLPVTEKQHTRKEGLSQGNQILEIVSM